MKEIEELRRFKNRKNYNEFKAFIKTWNDAGRSLKSLFLHLYSRLLNLDGTQLDFIVRPGVSFSLKAKVTTKTHERLLILMDLVDDDPANRWLSVCFYADAISDPGDLGNLVPKGIWGEDGYCFDVFEKHAWLLGYLEQRIEESYEYEKKLLKGKGVTGSAAERLL